MNNISKKLKADLDKTLATGKVQYYAKRSIQGRSIINISQTINEVIEALEFYKLNEQLQILIIYRSIFGNSVDDQYRRISFEEKAEEAQCINIIESEINKLTELQKLKSVPEDKIIDNIGSEQQISGFVKYLIVSFLLDELKVIPDSNKRNVSAYARLIATVTNIGVTRVRDFIDRNDKTPQKSKLGKDLQLIRTLYTDLNINNIHIQNIIKTIDDELKNIDLGT